MNKIRSILKPAGKARSPESERLRAALAETAGQIQQLGEQRREVEGEIAAALRRALDGDSTAQSADALRDQVTAITRRIADLDLLSQELRRRLGIAQANESAVELAARWNEVERLLVHDATTGVEKIMAGIQLIVAGLKQTSDATAEAYRLAPIKPATLPDIWRPSSLVTWTMLELERAAPGLFRKVGRSMVSQYPTLKQRHQLAVGEILPTTDQPKAA
ncbi:MAG: hypothetical protein IT483_15785 [Gammaproteobacteria bacterium]|nr:hypothetical protein [Gammaproteobacteria bacterium]